MRRVVSFLYASNSFNKILYSLRGTNPMPFTSFMDGVFCSIDAEIKIRISHASFMKK